MKLSNKPNIGAGIVLLLLAAFFSISLILKPLNFGSLWTSQGNILYVIGNILYSVYGFSSAIIPLFLFIAAISCFASKWTARKSMRLLTAVVPFFTAVGVEKICRAMIENPYENFLGVKLGSTITIGAMLIVIEILAAGLIADKINNKLFHKKTAPSLKPLSEFNEAQIEEYKKEDSSNSDESDSAEESLNFHDENTTELAPVQESTLPEAENTESDVKEKNDPFADVFDEAESTESEENSIFDENPASIITQEEYEALAFDNSELETAETSSEEPEENEIVWPDSEEIKIQAGNNQINQTEISKNQAEEDNELPPACDEDSPYYTGLDLSEDENKKSEDTDKTDSEEESPYFEELFENKEDKAVQEHSEPKETSDLEEPVENSEKSPESLSPDFFDIDINSPEISNSEEDGNFEQEDITKKENKDETLYEDAKVFADDDETFYSEQDSFLSDPIEEPAYFLDGEPSSKPEKNYKPSRFDKTQDFGVASDVFADMAFDAKNEFESSETSYQENPAEAENCEALEQKEVLNPDENLTSSNKDNIAESVQVSNRAAPKKPYFVPTDLLEKYEDDQYWIVDEQTKSDALKLKETLNQFSIEAEVIGIKKGPVVTMYELAPAPGVKLSKIVSLQDNIALSLAASSVRIVAPIPGKAAVGIEVPNKKRSIVSFREMIEQDLDEFKKMSIPVILGKDILGKSQIIDIAKTPHLLIAGATGAGKSVCVNSIILSILYKRSPKEVKLILVDPKVVELKLYNDIPHLLTPVITEPKRALQALQYCLCEMERRYALLDGMGVRNIMEYNKRIEERNICTEKLPYIVIIIDEFADLMATSGKELESNVARLAAMSRAVGIHLVLATQRPSVNVITGLIKANIPSRIAFMVASRTDSNIIIDAVGAEKLLGKGDMLYASAVDPYPIRIQGTFESDNDVEKVVNYVKTLGSPEYIDDEIFVDDDEEIETGPSMFSDGDDPLYDQALDIVIQAGKASASYIQRRLKIGYNRAARLVEEMEERGIVGPANGSKPREIIHVPT